MKRPISLTILAWVIIVTNAITCVYTPFSIGMPTTQALLSHYLLPVWATLGISVIIEAANVVIGIAILKGREWSRKAYIVTFVFGIAFSLINMPASMLAVLIPGVLLFAVFVYLLFRRPATAYFRQTVA
ncbi:MULTISPECIES: hypothetical protein [Burkholderia]|uniref:hypothetical protein n=1 Tax=Burkholderia TaxID=32008 RepID=UPI00098159A0|nr:MULTISPECIES: hypothetical protein [Burkholderia]AQQ43854.1 hypothetical protein A8E75_33755 [Burkholderia cenocepacia]MBG0881062.1 hypothetical protein [Burkholderia sp. 9775_39]MBG0885253.1 hypothetical protein [Burkholderia sp. 9773_38]MBJ9898812.1 hypothetical protein [Burkholderia cenocepacia]MBJ9919729.1 hypothetical protein [Burkholderia cenocepacia]